jgi:hypothetical protein
LNLVINLMKMLWIASGDEARGTQMAVHVTAMRLFIQTPATGN